MSFAETQAWAQEWNEREHIGDIPEIYKGTKVGKQNNAV